MFKDGVQNFCLPLLAVRVISLLNIDAKWLAKVLDLRLESVLPTVISPDQTGFIKNRHSFFNVSHLFDIVYNPSSSQEAEIVVSLDAEKAFDFGVGLSVS